MRKATLFIIRELLVRKYLLLLFTLCLSIAAKSQNDCPPLTVFCQDLHTAFMADACMVEIWAKDFISKINDPETSFDSFDISFEKDSLVMSQIFESTGGNTYEICIWITSKCDPDLQTKCIVNLDINDNTGNCPQTPCPVDPNPWCGFAVVTCSANSNNSPVARIIDTRKNSSAPRGDDWANPQSGSAVNFMTPDDWTLGGIGQVFGTALNPISGDIYLGASDVYAYDFKLFTPTTGFPPPTCVGPAGSAGIYFTNFGTQATTDILITTTNTYPADLITFNSTIIGGNAIPNTGNQIDCDPITIEGRDPLGNGIGNLAFDKNSGHLFASNLEDGKIYSIDVLTETITAVLDPLTPYSHSSGLVAQSERVWGIQVSDCGSQSRLYFTTESTSNALVKNKSIYSIGLDQNGAFVGNEQLELIVAMGMQSKITDIAFSQDCNKMLLAERGHPHKSAVFEYEKNGDSWFFTRQYFIGIYDLNAPAQPQGNILGTSATGGVSYGPQESECILDNQCDSIVWATLNCGNTVEGADRCDVYGAEGISANGNNALTNGATDIFIDFNPQFNGSPTLFKGGIGDIDVFNCCCPGFEKRDTLVIAKFEVAGAISTSALTPLRNVDVSLQTSAMTLNNLTNDDGIYNFGKLEENRDYMIIANMKDNPLDGISTLDMIMIQRHILGLSKFKTPNKYVAADVNNSGDITVTDLVELRRLILGITDQFESNNTWNFVSHKNLNSTSLENINQDLEKYISLTHLSENSMNNNFVGIKTGDVNQDNRYESSATSRSLEGIELEYKLDPLSKDENGIYVDIYSKENVTLTGMQFALNVPSDISFITSPLKGFDQHNYEVINGVLNLSWHNTLAQVVGNDAPLFRIYVENYIAEMTINSEKLNSELYDSSLDAYNIYLSKVTGPDSDHNIRVVPNPLHKKGAIIFDMPDEGLAQIDIYSIDGKKVSAVQGHYKKGVNSVNLDPTDMDNFASGIFIVRITSNKLSSTSQFIMME